MTIILTTDKVTVYFIWGTVGIIVMATTVFSYLFLRNLNLNALGIIESFASGAILAMLTDSMMPEAYEECGYLIGILTVFGFLTAFIFFKI